MAVTLAFDVYGTLIDTHGVVAKLEDAFNELMASKPSDPMGFLASKLK